MSISTAHVQANKLVSQKLGCRLGKCQHCYAHWKQHGWGIHGFVSLSHCLCNHWCTVYGGYFLVACFEPGTTFYKYFKQKPATKRGCLRKKDQGWQEMGEEILRSWTQPAALLFGQGAEVSWYYTTLWGASKTQFWRPKSGVDWDWKPSMAPESWD